jgi:GNAT superfamily N-acetyltransferase
MRRPFGFRNVRVWLWSVRLPAEPATTSWSIECRPIPVGDAGALAALGLPPDRLADRLNWSQCYVGRVGDELASSGWVSRTETWVGEVASTLRPDDGDAYIWDCQTAPAFRGRGFYRDLLTQVLADLGQAGLRRAWIATLDRDSPGYRGVARAGFGPVASIRYVSIGPFRRWWLRPHEDADPGELQAARKALRLGQRPERIASTRPLAAPPAPVPR